MKNVWVKLAPITLFALLLFFGTIFISDAVYADETPTGPTHAQDFADDQPGYIPTPPPDKEDCEARGGNWEMIGRCHGVWSGMDKWNEFTSDNLDIKDSGSCRDKDGVPVSDSGDGILGFLNVEYRFCNDFTDYSKWVQIARNTPIDPTNESTPPRDTHTDELLALGTDAEDGDPVRECNAGSMGWAICSIANTLASMVDGIYNLMVDFVIVPSINTDSAIYQVWATFRNIANIVFVVLMLVALFSQISNIGLNNYGIKRLLPRIIISAVLVNMSFFICQIFVDISNIVGQGLYLLLNSIADKIPIDGGYETGTSVWTGAILGVLSAGALGSIGVAGFNTFIAASGVAATGTGAASTLVWIALPLLLVAVLAVFTSFAILGLRFVLIYVLIAISPLAFVAYLLPNTAKYFDKWKDIFVAILFFYPLFSILFGMSQIVSMIVLASAKSTADESGSMMGAVMILFGLFIQVAPLFVSYRLLQTANSIAGTLANGVQKQGSTMVGRAKDKKDETVKTASEAGRNRHKARGTFIGRQMTRTGTKRATNTKRRETWANQAEMEQARANYASADYENADYSARASQLGVNTTNKEAQARFIAALAKDSQALDAFGNPIAGKTDPNEYAKMAAGGFYRDKQGEEATAMTDSVIRSAQAAQSAEARKEITAEFSGQTLGQLQAALRESLSKGDVNKSQALQSMLLKSGEKGVSMAVSTEREIRSQASTPEQYQALDAMRENMRANHGDLKAQDAALYSYATAEDSANPGTLKYSDIDAARADGAGAGGLSPSQVATQTTESLRALLGDNNANTAYVQPSVAYEITQDREITRNMNQDKIAVLQEYVNINVAAGTFDPATYKSTPAPGSKPKPAPKPRPINRS